MIIIVFGVSGSGKSTIGELLSKELSIPFYDGDDFHPKTNIDKMSNGVPLNDDDRKPWLKTLAKKIKTWSTDKGAVLACSALKENYREILGSLVDDTITWVYLSGSIELIAQRMVIRENHFMPIHLLESQFETLEIPEYGMHVDISADEESIVKSIVSKL